MTLDRLQTDINRIVADFNRYMGTADPKDPELTEADDAPDDEVPDVKNDVPDEPVPEQEGDKPPTQGVGLGGLS